MCFYLLLFLRLWYIVYNYVGLCHIKGWYKLLKYFGRLLLKHIGPTFGWCDAQLLGQLGQLFAQLVAAFWTIFVLGSYLNVLVSMWYVTRIIKICLKSYFLSNCLEVLFVCVCVFLFKSCYALSVTLNAASKSFIIWKGEALWLPMLY